MKNLILTTACILISIPLFADTNPVAQQLLLASKRQASLFHEQVSPIQLEVDFRAQMKVPMQGHVTLRWGAKDRWWRRIIMGDFQQIDIRNGDMLYTSRNLNFTPIRIGELVSLLQFAEDAEGLRATKEKRRVKKGVDMTCLRVEQESGAGRRHEVCLNSTSHDILSDTWQEWPDDERRMERYADYLDFAGRRYPRKLQLIVNGSTILTANVQRLMVSAFDETLLIAPKSAIQRRQCDGMKKAVPIRTPDPVYPRFASQNNMMGDTMVSMTILADGSVGDVQLTGSAAPSMDDATLQTLKDWKFKPAMCGTEPVVSDIEAVVSFRLR